MSEVKDYTIEGFSQYYLKHRDEFLYEKRPYMESEGRFFSFSLIPSV